MKRVKPIEQVSDENFMKHLELRHPGDLKMEFKVEPGRDHRRMHCRSAWEAFHEAIHRISADPYDHFHAEPEAGQ